jgi:TPR repeat protein
MSGDALSQFMLGEAYEEGADGFTVNTKIAAKWYRKAADQRDARAQAALGRLYEFGDGVPANHQLALDWVRRATAEAPGSAMAIVVRYEQEKPPNEAKATEWLLISADAGDVRAQNRLGELYDTADAGGNYIAAAGWYLKAADQEYPKAIIHLADLYFAGKGVPQDYGEAVNLYWKSIKRGDRSAAYKLGALYEEGRVVMRDPITAMELYQSVADGNPVARGRLLALFAAQMPMPGPEVDSLAWYREAAAKGDRRAQEALGLRYEFGEGVSMNVVAAYALYELAASAQDQPTRLPNFVRSLRPPETSFQQSIMTLAQEMAKPGNFLSALDRFLAQPTSDYETD